MSATASPDFVPLWINGRQCPASDGQTFEVRNPQSQRVVSVCASATSDDCRAAIVAAGEAFKTWERTPIALRRSIFLKAADLMESAQYYEKALSTVIEETAAEKTWVGLNTRGAASLLREMTTFAAQLKGETWPSVYPGATALMQRQPIGVILAIAPSNAPVILSLRAICIPILCGNTAVLKSSEYSPRSQALVAELLQEAGLPDGVLNYISCSRADSPRLTAEIIGHPLVRKINFTGSDTVGRIIATEAAKYLKPCVLELGGKAPAVVLNDADVEDASRGIIYGAMVHSGQVCMSTERVIVQRGIAPALITALTRLASKIKADDPNLNQSAHLGCLFSEASAQNVCSMIEEAKQMGAEILVGDGSRDGPLVQPHVIRGVKPGMRLWSRESFGPVLGITEVDTVDEAIELANHSDYSLVASLWTKSASIELARRIRAGCVSVNGATFHAEPQFGHGGLGGASGYGRFDIEDWTNKRLTVLHPPKQNYPLVDGL